MDSVVPVVGSIYINAINVTLDPSVSLRDTTHLLKLVRPKLILVEESSIELIESALKESNFETEVIVMGNSSKYLTYSEFLTPKEGENKFIPSEVDNIKNTAIIFFSSGTTGLPKGIEIPHSSVIYMVESILIGIAKYTCAMHFTSFYWMTALITTFLVIRSGGRKIVVKKFEPETALAYIEKYEIVNVFMPPSFTYQFTEDLVRKHPCLNLKAILLGGSSISTEHLKKLRNYFPRCAVFNSYAQTEAGGLISSFFLPAYSKFGDKLTSSGQPVFNISLKIVDPETEEELGCDQKGEIRILTPGLCNGYYNQDSSSMLDKSGYLKTGDIGYYDEDNFIHVCDRIKDMFKYRSWHIVPLSLENVIYEHPAVKETIVIGIPREVDGHIPMALVVLKDDSRNVSAKDILDFANSKLLEREQLRGGLEIVKDLPKGTTGKISRKHITDLVISGELQSLIE
ncbi:AMP-binding protein [Oryctes borbonicus]|uniref:AMP-binding protein n=1 Tax=Oryctes borbonicus TaxID=1629725 RepID=A0A0T6B536_9SCAR|nr:AMP-binding protein [Oryctes borbonicus]